MKVFQNTISTLSNLATKKGINYSLDKLTPILEKLGSPEKKLPTTIHIAGTNGKGSTTAFIRTVLKEYHLNVFTFTSPHLDCYTERLSTNDKPISKTSFISLFNAIKPFMKHGLTEFETLTLMALLHCKYTNPDVCIFEVGLGGRLDATNVITPNCSIITTIDFDHEAILGNTLKKIANEKAGIIKQNIPVITTSTQKESVINQIKKKAIQYNAPLFITDPMSQTVNFPNMIGAHQKINASLAKKAIQLVFPNITNNFLDKALKKTCHWGRLHTIKTDQSTIIIDAAHNISGLKSLINTIHSEYDKQLATVIFGLHQSKNAPALCPIIETIASTLHYCEFDSTLAMSLPTVQSHCTKHLIRYKLGSQLPKASLIIITGSIYFIGQFYKQHASLLKSKKHTH